MQTAIIDPEMLLDTAPSIDDAKCTDVEVHVSPDDGCVGILLHFSNGVQVWACNHGVSIEGSSQHISWQDLIKHVPFSKAVIDA